MYKKQIEKFNEYLNDYLITHAFSGVIRITVKGEIIYERAVGYADFENKIAFSKDSMFTYYSISKCFCALGIMKLVDKGLVDLDVHPKTYLKEFNGYDERLTIRHMLYHASGVEDFEQNKEFYLSHDNDQKNIRKNLVELLKYPMRFAPNEGSMYANVNYVTMALIIEEVTGKTYKEYMEEEVFKPLGMTTALIDYKGMPLDNRVKGYDIADGALKEVPKSFDYMFGAGDVVGTVDDLYRVNLAIKNKTFLSENAWKQVLIKHHINGMGLGCNILNWYGKIRIQHNGGHSGFRTLHIQLPKDDFDIILLSNTGFGDARNDISELIHKAFYPSEHIEGNKFTVVMDAGYIK